MSDTLLVGVIAAVSALGGALIGSLSGFFTQLWQAKRADKSALADRRSRAYVALLTQSTYIMQLATNLHIIMQFRSGLQEGLHVTIGRQQPIDAIVITEKMTAEMKPLYEAWSEIWAVGSEAAIAQANDIVAYCGNVVGTATQRGEAVPEFLRRIIGERWTKAQLDEWEKAQRQLAEARKKFGEIARKEAGVANTDLFSSNELNRPALQAKRCRFLWLR